VSSPDPIDVLVLGELNPDLLLSGSGITPRFGQVETLVDHADLTLGSSGAIFAAGAARLGLRTAIAGLVGEDAFGDFVMERLRQAGISTEGVVVDPSTTTGLTVILNRGEDRAILTHLGAMAQMTTERVHPRLLSRARHVHVTSYFLQRSLQQGLPDLLSEAHRHGASTSLDTNWDPDERWDDGVRDLLEHVDVFLPNEAEALALTGAASVQAAAEQLHRTVPQVVVKRGAQGAYLRDQAGVLEARPPAVTVRDTTGAGDSFDAGYIYGLLRDLPPAERLRAACAAGALSTRGVGGVKAQASEHDLRAALAPEPA